MKVSRSSSRAFVVYAVILGGIYLIIGAAKFTAGLWHLFQPENATAILNLLVDLFGGFSALVIGAAYSSGTSLWKGKTEFLGFLLIATILSIVFGLFPHSMRGRLQHSNSHLGRRRMDIGMVNLKHRRARNTKARNLASPNFPSNRILCHKSYRKRESSMIKLYSLTLSILAVRKSDH